MISTSRSPRARSRHVRVLRADLNARAMAMSTTITISPRYISDGRTSEAHSACSASALPSRQGLPSLFHPFTDRLRQLSDLVRTHHSQFTPVQT